MISPPYFLPLRPQADQCVEELIALGYEQTVIIGVVGDHAPERERWVTCHV